MNNLLDDEIRKQVRARYGEIGEMSSSGCCCSGSTSSCCGDANHSEEISQKIGYSSKEMRSAPEDANLGLGCGNPLEIAKLEEGETVLDLGSGGGFDAFLAAEKVGNTGRVIGVDMTPKMIDRARMNADKGDYVNVEFRLGEIENLPIKDNFVDVIISNCVINLSPEKQRVFAEAFRVLKKGGRLAISDVLAIAPIPAELKRDGDRYSACISGAEPIESIEEMLTRAGFEDIHITVKKNSREIVEEWDSDFPVAEYIASATIQAKKPNE